MEVLSGVGALVASAFVVSLPLFALPGLFVAATKAVLANSAAE